MPENHENINFLNLVQIDDIWQVFSYFLLTLKQIDHLFALVLVERFPFGFGIMGWHWHASLIESSSRIPVHWFVACINLHRPILRSEQAIRGLY